jgi:hypothetical protein
LLSSDFPKPVWISNPVKISNEQVLPGEAATILYYPENTDLVLVTANITTTNEPMGGIGLEASLSAVAAGSPIFNKFGSVIAVVTGGDAKKWKVRAIPIRFARPLLSMFAAP